MINLKNASLLGLLTAIIAMVTLVFRESLFAVGPVGIIIQVLAAMLMLWARITFGTRSFHASANPTDGGLVTSGPYKFPTPPDLCCNIILYLGGNFGTSGGNKFPAWIRCNCWLVCTHFR